MIKVGCVRSIYFLLCHNHLLLLRTARKLNKKYLNEDSKLEVDLPPKLRDEITQSLANPTPTLFNKAQRHVFRNMLQDQFPRFLKSKEYRAYENTKKRNAAKSARLRSTMNRRGLRKKSIQADFLHLAGKKFNTVQDVLGHAVAARYFKEYLEAAHNAEALHFYMEVRSHAGGTYSLLGTYLPMTLPIAPRVEDDAQLFVFQENVKARLHQIHIKILETAD